MCPTLGSGGCRDPHCAISPSLPCLASFLGCSPLAQYRESSLLTVAGRRRRCRLLRLRRRIPRAATHVGPVRRRSDCPPPAGPSACSSPSREARLLERSPFWSCPRADPVQRASELSLLFVLSAPYGNTSRSQTSATLVPRMLMELFSSDQMPLP